MFTPRRWIFAALAVVTVLFLLAGTGHAPQAITEKMPNGLSSFTSTSSDFDEPAHAPGERFAFATFMNPPMTPLPTDEDDDYFTMARMIAFQLLHNPETKTRKGYPFLVLVSEGVSETKQERLRKDGATVIPVQRITSDWLRTKNSQWWDQLTKLRLFELTQFDKIAYFDTDTLIRRNVDDIFHDEATNIVENPRNPDHMPADEGEQPARYMFAGNAGVGKLDHSYPPPPNRRNLNAGCFVIMPSLEVFNYYLKVMSIEGRFPLKYMEQGLLAYVHRWDGNMPWKQMNYTWNTNYATVRDIENDIATLHSKFWQVNHDPKLTELAYDIKGRMFGYWLGRDERKL